MTSSPALPEALRAPLSTNVALLLESRIPARIAWVAADGTPRVAPIWFAWTGTELVMSTFAGSRKTADLRDGTIVAATIDTDDFPYRSISIRGPITLQSSAGLSADYTSAADRYLGAHLAERWLDFVGSPDQVVMALQPTMAVASDLGAQSGFFTD